MFSVNIKPVIIKLDYIYIKIYAFEKPVKLARYWGFHLRNDVSLFPHDIGFTTAQLLQR